MPTELEELVSFIASRSPQIRQLAVVNLVPYSTTEPSVFKAANSQPIKNLKVLVRDHPSISEYAITILVNLSGDREVLELLATDEKFMEYVFSRLVNPEEPNANLLAMLLANLAKWEGFKDMLKRKQPAPSELGSDDMILNQLMDLFVKGQDGTYNKKANFDYLAYVFADLAKHEEIRRFFLEPQNYDGGIPLTKLKVFTEHKSDIRRKGVASTIKNVAFEIKSHPDFLDEEKINILPYILLPIIGGEEYDAEDALAMLPDLQLLPPDKQRDSDPTIVQTYVETLMLLTTTREGRDIMREIKVYPIIRETHLRVEHEGVQEACERLVQVLMRDEDDGEQKNRVEEVEDDEDSQLVEV
ncbi:Protein HGH1 [Paramyrothecium foliicola]|nr:Protein HGH1 [Paramyrothecium foliicola]